MDSFYDKIDLYFNVCNNESLVPTQSGLALNLGLESRLQLLDLAAGTGKKAHSVKRALLRIEAETVQALLRRDTSTGARWLLSVMGYGGTINGASACGVINVNLVE